MLVHQENSFPILTRKKAAGCIFFIGSKSLRISLKSFINKERRTFLYHTKGDKNVSLFEVSLTFEKDELITQYPTLTLQLFEVIVITKCYRTSLIARSFEHERKKLYRLKKLTSYIVFVISFIKVE